MARWEQEAYEVIRALVSDVRAVGPKKVKEDWPDLYITYQDAVTVFNKAKRQIKSGEPE